MAAKADAFLYEPSPRWGHYACHVGEYVYVCFGHMENESATTRSELCLQVEVYDCFFKTWAQRKTTGTPPPGLSFGAYTNINELLYTYGGRASSDKPFTGTSLNWLNTTTMQWHQLTSNNGPMKKRGTGMVAFNRGKTLALLGGYGIPVSPTQPGSSFVKNRGDTDGRGWTNEFHIFSIDNGTWSSPLRMTGSRPPPCGGFSFTSVDENRAVVFGGTHPGYIHISDVYIIDFNIMNWTKIEPRVGEPWPEARALHAACCLGYGGEHPQLLISGGWGSGLNVYSDIWIFNLSARKWKKVKLTLPNVQMANIRCGHSITTTTLEPGLVEVIMFGGSRDRFGLSPIADTTILKFKFIGSTMEWVLKDVVTNTERAVEVDIHLENQRHYEAYQQALSSDISISLKYIKLLMFGPPRSGKTSLRRRLLGEITNLNGQAIQPSSGTVDARNVIVKIADQKMTSYATAISETTWRSVGKSGADDVDVDEELYLLYQFIIEGSVGHASTKVDEPRPSADNSVVQKVQKSTGAANTETKKGLLAVILDKFSWKKSEPLQEAVPTNATVTEDESLKVTHHTESDSEIESAFKAFNNALRSHASQQQLKVLLEKTILLNMVDTGGQPAFIEMLPMLTIGPALYLIFLRLDQELKRRYQIHYISEENEEVPLDESYTLQEIMFQVLSSIACYRSNTSSRSTTSSPTKQQITSHQSQAAMLVGTYKDKLEGSPEEVKSKIQQIDGELQEELKEILDTDLFKASNNLMRYASNDQLIFDVDNMTGSADEVKTIQKRLEQLILHEFDELPIPASWLMFGLFLRKLGKHTISLSQCEEIGCRLRVKDIHEAIWFLHHCIGVLMYYPDVMELKDVVICDPQIVFDSVTELILNTFKFGNVSKAACDKFKQTGQFRFKDIQKLSKKLKSGILPLPQLVKLLEYLNIIARISSPDSSTVEKNSPLSDTPQLASTVPLCESDENAIYFMPAVLSSAKESELNVFHSPLDPAPLMIHFKSGFVPVGVFCASIASLVANKKLGWTLQEPQRSSTTGGHTLYKDCVIFRVHIQGGSYDITLISKPKQYEVHITLCSGTGQPSHDICKHVLETVCHTLDSVLSKLKDKQYLALSSSDSLTQSPYELGFQCPLHPQEDHLVVNRPHSGEMDICLSASDLWFCYLENKSNLVCLKEDIVVNLTRTGTHDALTVASDISHVKEGVQIRSRRSGHVDAKYGLWMGPLKDGNSTVTTITTTSDDVQRSSTSKMIHNKDWAAVCDYLHKLNLPQCKRLGAELGLSIFNLNRMQNLPDDMITAWFRMEDDVKEKSGDPLTWSALVKALQRIGHQGIADDISRDKCVAMAT